MHLEQLVHSSLTPLYEYVVITNPQWTSAPQKKGGGFVSFLFLDGFSWSEESSEKLLGPCLPHGDVPPRSKQVTGPFFLEGGVGEVDGWRTNQLTNQPTPPNVPPVWNKSLMRPYINGNQWLYNEPLIKPGFISWALGGYVWGVAGWPVTGLGKFGEISGIRSMCLLDSFSRSMRVPHKLPYWNVVSILNRVKSMMTWSFHIFRFAKLLGSKRILLTNFCSPLSQKSSHSNKHLP